MQNIDLEIDNRYWIGIIIIGIVLSSLLSIIVYLVSEYNVVHGLEFGLLLGFCITVLAFLFTTIANNYILPKVDKKYWVTIAALFSFVAGFGGAHTTTLLALYLHIEMIDAYFENYYYISFFIGLMTYFIGLLMWLFVKLNNQNNHINQLLVSSRLRSLERQLNPHFLFNSLNSLAELIHKDTDKSEEMILGLSRFLRNSMREDTLIPLKNEIENLNEYLKLENIRFDKRVVLKLGEYQYLQEVMIPKFSIQLIVENAIKHGFSNKNENFYITIGFQKVESRLKIRIQNSGEPIVVKNFGIGLSNLNQRLALLCDGGVEITNFEYPEYIISIGLCDENSSR